MANIGDSLEKIIKNAAKQLGKFQINTNKILWGSANTQPKQTVTYNHESGSLKYEVTPTIPTPPKTGNLVESGLFNALDALNRVDLCNVVTYLATNVPTSKKPRNQNPTQAEKTLYNLQDRAQTVQQIIDTYTAYPNSFISSYISPTGPKVQTAHQAQIQNGVPEGAVDISGNNIKKYNLYFLIQSIKDTFTVGGANSIFTPEDVTLIASVPGLGSNLNFLNDFLGLSSKYTDYRSIPNSDIQKLETKISQVRTACVAIQTLNFSNVLALTGNFLSVDIRNQIQEISKFLDPTKIIPTLKQVNSAVQSFIRIANQLQNIIKQSQFLIKLAILFIKVFKFILFFFGILPIPSLYLTAGAQTKIQDAKNAAKDNSDSLVKLLKEVNSLLTVVLIFVRYLLANANELLTRLELLLATLEGCVITNPDNTADKSIAFTNSDVVAQLRQTTNDLRNLRDQLAAYVIAYDSKNNPNTAKFGKYSIRVVDEQVTDPSIRHKRRRGIALDVDGAIVVQSDLTFATNSNIIIEEVQLKLMANGLVQPSLSTLNSSSLAIVTESLSYLEVDDINQDDLNIASPEMDSPDNTDEDQGLGLNAFINNLKGGKAMRKRVRKALDKASSGLKSQIATEKSNSDKTLKG